MKQAQLTPKRERFAQEVVRLGNQTAAYKIAYPRSKKWPEEDVCSKASHLMADGNVLARVNALRRRTEGRLAYSRDRWLARWIAISETGDFSAQLRALENIGKALGYYAPEKIAVHEDRPIRVIGIEQRIAAIIAARKSSKPESV